MNKGPSFSARTQIENVLLLLLILAVLYALYDVLKAFFGVFTFALIFSVSFLKPFEKLVKLFKNRRSLSAFVYSLLLIAIIAVPFIYIISSVGHHVKDSLHTIKDMSTNDVPPLPSWITNLPYVGEKITSLWQQLHNNPREAMSLYGPQVKSVLHRILAGSAGMLISLFEVIAGIIVSAIFLVHNKKISKSVHTVIKHMVGDKDSGELMNATTQAIRGVTIGVMGTAFIAATIAWIGFAIAGIPFAILLAAIVFFLVIIQAGPLLLWIPLVTWMVMQGETGWAIFIGIWGIMLVVIDAVLKPILIAKSGRLPFLVLFLGVIGGTIAWGFTGIFKGAIIVAVCYTMLNSWLAGKGEAEIV